MDMLVTFEPNSAILLSVMTNPRLDPDKEIFVAFEEWMKMVFDEICNDDALPM